MINIITFLILCASFVVPWSPMDAFFPAASATNISSINYVGGLAVWSSVGIRGTNAQAQEVAVSLAKVGYLYCTRFGYVYGFFGAAESKSRWRYCKNGLFSGCARSTGSAHYTGASLYIVGNTEGIQYTGEGALTRLNLTRVALVIDSSTRTSMGPPCRRRRSPSSTARAGGRA